MAITALARLRQRVPARRLLHAALAGVVVGLLHVSGLTLALDKRNYDLWFQLSPASDSFAQDVAIVAIDDKSLRDATLGEWPWPSRRIGELLEKVDQAQPAAVGLDILLDCPRDQTDPELARTLGRLPNVVVAANLRSGPDPGTLPGMAWPLPRFLRPDHVGFANAVEDRPDGFIRSWQLAAEGKEAVLYSFSLVVALAAEGKRGRDTRVSGDSVWIPQGAGAWSRWPLVSAINFHRPGRVASYSAADAMMGRLPPDALSGKVVLVGGTAAGAFADVFATPFFDDLPTGRRTAMHGVEVLANAVETLLTGVRVREAHPLAVALGALVFVLLACAILRLLHPVLGAAAVVAMALASGAACLYLFISHQLQVPVTPFAVGAGAAYLVVVLEKQAAADAERRSAEQRNILLRDLSAMVTHDLKGPLTSTMGFLELLLREKLPEHQRSFAEIALGSSKWLSILVTGVLDVARMEAGQLTLNRAPLDIGHEIQQALVAVSYQLRERDLRVETTMPAELPPVSADSEVLQRVIVNLVDNAAKFAPVGSTIRLDASLDPPLTVRQEAGPARAPAVTISVRDEGPGIAREYQSRVFDKFVQVAKGRSTERISVGLGLAFCRLAVEAHGGSIWVESEPGHGSRFSFRLPLDPLLPEGGRNRR